MSTFNSTDDFERYKLDVENHDGHHAQRVCHTTSGAVTWQVWKRKRHLGYGAFGEVQQEVWEDEHGDIHYRAVKVCSELRMRAVQIDYRRELSALAAFSKSEHSGYFVNLHGWWILSGNLFVAMEYLGHGDLSRYVASEISESEIKEIAQNIFHGVEVMHTAGFTHRDIKPQNILVYQKRPEHQRWWVKIADFGISKQTSDGSDTVLHTMVGTRPYCAPEILGLLEQHQTSIYTNKVDIWSIGCVLFNLISRGQMAFSERELGRYCDGRVPFNPRDLPLFVGIEGKLFVEDLLQAFPERRPTATQAKQHKWFITTSTSFTSNDRASSRKEPSLHRDINPFLSSASIGNPAFTPEIAQLTTRSVTPKPTKSSANLSDTLVNTLPLTQDRPASGTDNVQATKLDPTISSQAPKGREPVAALIKKDTPILNGVTDITLPIENESLEDRRKLNPTYGQDKVQATSRETNFNLTDWLEENKARLGKAKFSRDTTLHHAACQGHLEAMQCLVERGADINAKNDNGLIPLHSAASQGHLEAIQYLVKRGADVNAKDYRGLIPLHYAASQGHLEAIQYLVERGADVNAKNNNGLIPLHSAASQGRLEALKCLVERGADVSIRDIDGLCTLHFAARQGYLEAIRFLVEQGADVNKKDIIGWNPLCYAVRQGHLEAVRYLFEQGADVNVRDYNGLTPLHAAASKGYLEATQYLVERGADINAKDVFRKTPFQTAQAGGHSEVARFLKKQNPGFLEKGIALFR